MDRGYWVPMPSGTKFYPMDPRPEDFNIEDIAHKLAMQCRYGGGTTRFYSVAEHCSKLATHALVMGEDVSLAYELLMHDRAEAYLQDFIRPMKELCRPWYFEIEANLERMSAPVFGLPHPMSPRVLEYDYRICIDEKRQLIACEYEPSNDLEKGEPLGIDLSKDVSPEQARFTFLALYHKLREIM